MRRGTNKHHIERPGVEDHYTLEYVNKTPVNFIPYEHDFDYNIIKPNINPVADSLVNEIWPLLRTLWLAYGSYNLTIKFDHNIDVLEWGHSRTPTDDGKTQMYANIHFRILDNGDYISKHAYDVQIKTTGFNNNEDNYDFKLDWEGQGNWKRPEVTKN